MSASKLANLDTLSKNCLCKVAALAGPKCINCNTIYHPSCLKKKKKVEIITVNCCSELDLSPNPTLDEAVTGISHKDLENKYLREIINNKDEMIEELRDKIKVLNKTINLLERNVNNDRERHLSTKSTARKVVENANCNINKQTPKPINTNIGKPINTPAISKITTTEQDTILHINPPLAKATSKQSGMSTENPINTMENPELPVVENQKSKNQGEWQTVQKRRKQSQPTVCGTLKQGTIKGVARYRYIHVYMLDPQLTCEQLSEYLVNCNFKNIKCDALNSNHPQEYSSFKVGVPETQIEELKDPNIWPENVRINDFLGYLQKKNRNPT